ncbi:MAG: hypothetical protein INR68_17680 [Methylobacterium mesophilicum]|nr:hypothetical protein [Methylobacterium mesophilicum]
MPSDAPQSNKPSDSTQSNKPETTVGAGASGKPADADLQKQVGKLREDVAGIAEALKGMAGNHAGNAREQAYAVRDNLRSQGEEYLRVAQDTATELEEQFSEKVRAEPIKYVLIAAAVGYVYARLFH